MPIRFLTDKEKEEKGGIRFLGLPPLPGLSDIGNIGKTQTSTPAFISPKTSTIQSFAKDVFTGADYTAGGITRNTILGIPSALKDILIPSRGYSEEELKEAKPSTKDVILTLPKLSAEIISSLGTLLGSQEGSISEKILETKFGDTLADISKNYTEVVARPQTAEEAKAMRGLDALTLLPVGSIKVSATGARAISKTNDVVKIFKVLKKEIPELTDDSAKVFSNLLKNVTDEAAVQRVLNKTEYALKGAKQETTALVTQNMSTKTPFKGFAGSANQKLIRNTNFSIGDYGRNAIENKTIAGKEDRLSINKLEETISNIRNVYKAGNTSFRKDNLVHVAEMPDGETRAIVTRLNNQGQEEIINFFKVGKDKDTFIKNLESFGVPSQSRTGISNLEGSQSNPLTYGNKVSISDTKGLSSQGVDNSLAQEAKKYATAEEFVESGQEVFRGGRAIDTTKVSDKGISVSTDADVARKFRQTFNRGQDVVGENLFISPNARIMKFEDIPTNLYDKNKVTTNVFPTANEAKLVDFARKNGYDAIDLRKFGTKTINPESEIRIVNPAILKTKSQLTDIWKEANAKTPLAESKVARPEAQAKTPGVQELTPKEQSQLQVLKQETLAKSYTPKTQKAIEQTAQDVGDSVKETGRVVSGLRKAKTSIIEYVQDSQRRVLDLVRRPDVTIKDTSDPYLKATLYPGRVSSKIEATQDKVSNILSDMSKAGVTREDVSNYLLYRHAPERNLAIGEKAAGITTKEAQTNLKILEESGKPIKQFADQVQAINNEVLDILKEGGVITDELYTTLRTKYKNHVPLQRIFEETEDIGTVLSGKGFDVRSTGIKAAKGSEREVADIMTNVINNYEQAVLRAEKNIVDQATLNFVRENKDILGDLFEIKHPKAVGKTFNEKIITERTSDPNILQMYENGKRTWIKVNDPKLAVALRGVGREKLGPMMRVVASFSRLYSGLATRFNPEFVLSNKIRDLQEAMVYLSAQKQMGLKSAAKTSIRDPKSVKDVIDFYAGKNTEGAKLYKEMRDAGGTTGGMALSTRKRVELSMERLEKLQKSKVRNLGARAVEYVDIWNTIFEDSTRLSAYKSALDSGMTPERAAAIAKESSINFNKMGVGGPVINGIWMFSNASIQGSAKMISSLKNPKVLGAVLATIGVGTAAINEFNDHVDPDWRDKVSKWDRLNGWPIVLPSSDEEFRYLTIPTSWGLKPIKVMSDYAYDSFSQDIDTRQMFEDLFTATWDAYNPVGGTDITSAAMPTILDVPFEIKRNLSWSGNKIKPDWDPNAPADIRYYSSLGETKTGQVAISLSELLNDNLGLAISPADMKYAYDQYIGGAGRAVTKTTNLIGSLNDPPPLDEWPMISRFYRERTGEEVGYGAGGQTQEIKDVLQQQSRERFKLRNEAESLYSELKKLPKDEANARANEIKISNPELFAKLKDIKQDEELGLTYQDKLIKQLGVENGERAKYIWEQVSKLKTPEEKNAYIQDLIDKKVISKNVFEQLKKLKISQ